jgi:hypothetical protein
VLRFKLKKWLEAGTSVEEVSSHTGRLRLSFATLPQHQNFNIDSIFSCPFKVMLNKVIQLIGDRQRPRNKQSGQVFLL